MPATLAPRSATVLINGSPPGSLLLLLHQTVVYSCRERYTCILVGGQVPWRSRRRRTSPCAGLPATHRSPGSFSTSRTASRQWFRQRTKCMLPDGHMHEVTSTIASLVVCRGGNFQTENRQPGPPHHQRQRGSPGVQNALFISELCTANEKWDL